MKGNGVVLAWIESHQNLQRHPKTLRAAAKLGVSVPTLIGHLHCLWWWSLDFAQDGDLSNFTHAEIAQVAMWDGEATSFVGALLQCGLAGRPGFLEQEGSCLVIHDWFDYTGRLMEQRHHEADVARRKQALYRSTGLVASVRQRDGDRCRYCGITVNWLDRRGAAGGCYDHIDPDGPNTIENVVVSCRRCNSGKSNRSIEAAGMRLTSIAEPERNQVPPERHPERNQVTPSILLDNRTLPYPTVQNRTEADPPLVVPPSSSSSPNWLQTLHGLKGWPQDAAANEEVQEKTQDRFGHLDLDTEAQKFIWHWQDSRRKLTSARRAWWNWLEGVKPQEEKHGAEVDRKEYLRRYGHMTNPSLEPAVEKEAT